MTALTSTDAIVQEITILAGAERVFQAITNPREVLCWWNLPGRFHAVQVEMDLRPAGRWSMRVQGCSQETILVSGEYREIDRPHLLLYTWVRDEDNIETLVRWELHEVDGVTTVRLIHSGLINEQIFARNKGWKVVLPLLQAHLEREGGFSSVELSG